jgi:STE24 endopeptidase
MVVQALAIVGGFYLAAGTLRAVVPWLGLRGEHDVAGAPVLLLVAGAWAFVTLPLSNAVSRIHERRADQFALELTANPRAFVTAMRRLGQQNLAEDHPSTLARWLFYSHPPMRERIAAAQRWAGVTAPLHTPGMLPSKE